MSNIVSVSIALFLSFVCLAMLTKNTVFYVFAISILPISMLAHIITHPQVDVKKKKSKTI